MLRFLRKPNPSNSFIRLQSSSSPPAVPTKLYNKGILKSKNETAEFQETMQKAKSPQKVPIRSSVIPLAQRFNRGGGIAKPEVESVIKAHPIDFDISRGGTQLKIKWRLSKVGGFTENDKSEPHQLETEQQQSPSSSSSSTTTIDNITTTTTNNNNNNKPKEYRIATTVISAELMRVCAPSTDVLSLPENVVVSGKRGVTFQDMHLVGNYAIRVSFSDGHTAGIYGYQYLYDLSGPEKWMRSKHYLTTLKNSRRSRDPPQRRGEKTTKK